MLLAMQRAVFIKAMPLRALGATAEQAIDICATIESHLPELVKRHSALRPAGCDRAGVHLERGCLALAAWDAIVSSDAACSEAADSDIIQCIAAGLGTDMSIAPDTDDTKHAGSSVPATAGFLQAAGVRFNSFFSTDQHTMVVGLVEKFHADLGKGFAVSPSVVHPPPSFEMDRCMYYTLAHEGGAPDLTGIFWAEHRAAFQSVSGFRFEGDHRDSPRCSFVFIDQMQDD